MRLIVGVDGGGTKTTAWLDDLDRIERTELPLGTGNAGPSNIKVSGFESSCREIQTAIERAFQNAGIELQAIDGLCLALAGVGDSETVHRLREWSTTTRLAKKVVITNDAHSILVSAFGNRSGIAAISGTGSLVYGRDTIAKTARAGGWGPLFGDQGSGYWIAIKAFRILADSIDRGQSVDKDVDELASSILQKSGETELRTFLRGVGRELSRSQIADFARIVIHLAERNDPVSVGIMHLAAAEFVKMIRCVVRNLEMESSLIKLAVAGSVFVHSSCLRNATVARLAELDVHVNELKLVESVHSGTLFLAQQEMRHS